MISKVRRIYRKLRGMNMIELMFALLLSSMCMIALLSITLVKMDAQTGLDHESTIIAVDSFFTEVYRDFKVADVVEVEAEDDGSYLSITLAETDGFSTLYTFSAESGEFRRDNIVIFECISAQATKTANNLYIAIKIAGDRLLELNAYR